MCVLPVKDLGLHLITLQEQAEGDELWRLKRACVKVHLGERRHRLSRRTFSAVWVATKAVSNREDKVAEMP